MSQDLMIGVVSIIIAGIGAQWLAWRLKWPSIILLLTLGFVGGPLTGMIKPDEVLGPLLMPLVSISVAVILFEGGLGLRLRELKQIGVAVLSLVSVGAFVNWVIITMAATLILDLSLKISILLGAILIVTGPTVTGPLLRHVRPSGKVANMIKWEGIVIDPIGAALAVLVYEYIVIGQEVNVGLILFFLKGIVIGGGIGALGAWILLFVFKRFWVPDYLHGTVTLMLVMLVFVLANLTHKESGLFSVIAMGIVLANQRSVEIQHIIRFKENLGILIISTLFIILGARLSFQDFMVFDVRFFLFMLVLIVIARPAAVFISTFKSGLTIKEKLLISWMAPRGIVAAAIASIFAFQLWEKGIPQAELLLPVTFLVIMTTVVVYGGTALEVARKLGLSREKPQGVLIVGAHFWARLIAKSLKDAGIKVVMIDSNPQNVASAQDQGLHIYEENVLDQDIEENIDLDDIGRMLAMTANDEANSLAALHFRELFGRSEIYQLAMHQKKMKRELMVPPALRGRFLFATDANFDFLLDRFSQGGVIKTVTINDKLSVQDFYAQYSRTALPLYLINDRNELKFFTSEEVSRVQKGDKVTMLVYA